MLRDRTLLRRPVDRCRGADGRVIAGTAVIVRPGNLPHDYSLLAGLACELNEAGFPLSDAAGRTSVPGIWAAGNVADPRAEVITSAAARSGSASPSMPIWCKMVSSGSCRELRRSQNAEADR